MDAFSWWTTSSGTPARRQRSGSAVHSRGRYNCQFSGHVAVSVGDADRDLAVRPSDRAAVLPGHPGRRPPALGEQHVDHTSGVTVSVSRSAIRRLTGSGSHGGWFTNCCRACMFPSDRRSAIGWTDFRRPSSIKAPQLTPAPPPLIPPRRSPVPGPGAVGCAIRWTADYACGVCTTRAPCAVDAPDDRLTPVDTAVLLYHSQERHRTPRGSTTARLCGASCG